MAPEAQFEQVQNQLQRIKRTAYAGWLLAFSALVMLFTMGAANQLATKGLIATVNDLQDRVKKMEAHVHIEDGETTIVADRFCIPLTRGNGWNKYIQRYAFADEDVGPNGHVAVFGCLLDDQGNVVGSHVWLFGNFETNPKTGKKEARTDLRVYLDKKTPKANYAGIYIHSHDHANPSEWARYFRLNGQTKAYEFPLLVPRSRKVNVGKHKNRGDVRRKEIQWGLASQQRVRAIEEFFYAETAPQQEDAILKVLPEVSQNYSFERLRKAVRFLRKVYDVSPKDTVVNRLALLQLAQVPDMFSDRIGKLGAEQKKEIMSLLPGKATK